MKKGAKNAFQGKFSRWIRNFAIILNSGKVLLTLIVVVLKKVGLKFVIDANKGTISMKQILVRNVRLRIVVCIVIRLILKSV